MSKLVLFCEGRRDVRLVNTYYCETQAGVTVSRFHAEDYAYSAVERQQPDRIRSFTSIPHEDVLAKSEGGRDALMDRFAEYLRMLMGRRPRVCLLLDLDTGPNGHAQDRYETKIDRVDSRVSDRHGEQYGVETDERVDRNETMLAATCRLTADDNGNTGSFSVLAFRTNLEDAAETGDHHSDKKQRQQLREFVASDAAAPMRAVL